MKDIQLLTIEIGDMCNLMHKHLLCPILLRTRGNRIVPNEKIISIVKEAYNELGFEGYVAWHYYNEPLLYKKRMFPLMKTLKKEVPQVKFLLWTNGELLNKDRNLKMFDRIVVTNYENRDPEYFKQFYHKGQEISIISACFDNRLNIKGAKDYEIPCLRPFIEFIISYYGDVHICCQDWKNEVKIGNVLDDSLESLVRKHGDILSTISNGMDETSPETCVTCTGRLPFIVRF